MRGLHSHFEFSPICSFNLLVLSRLTSLYGNIFPLRVHCVHMPEVSLERKPTPDLQPLLYDRAKQQEEQLKCCMTSNLVLQRTHEQSN